VSLQIETTRVEPDVIIVQLSGNITLVPEDQVSEPFVGDLLDTRPKTLIFDLTNVEHMDSSGVQLMVQCSTAVRKSGGELRLAGANPRVARLFQITRLDSILPLFPSVATACEGLTSGAP
jgi:anti-sigma B factor antagonist